MMRQRNALHDEELKHDERTAPESTTNGEKKEKRQQKEKAQRVPYHRLFLFADSTNIKGWEISAASSNLFRGISDCIYQRVASNCCHVIRRSTCCCCCRFYGPYHRNDGKPRPKRVCESITSS